MQNKTMEPTDHLPHVVSSVMVVYDVVLVGPSGQGLHVHCVAVCTATFWKRINKVIY